ncbi:MAG: peroxiredoxin [Gammaproteobacteria bacterium SHHR-1]|uniref:peroxiredoxin n=1 Tax=Magnetovirga frankeli TaxID=947516 RepID=UPI001293FAEF|nr:peroxiredoxin [gamma proteobacterium SS-5]
MLQPGQPAPVFELPDADMRMWDSTSLAGKNLVLFFYPKDNTTGCTLEAIEFTDLMEEFDAADSLVFGISRDDCVSHADFRDRHGLTVNLLADIDGTLCEAFGVWQEKERNGERRLGIVRSSFIIDQQGVIRHALYDVKPKGHAAQILELVKAL